MTPVQSTEGVALLRLEGVVIVVWKGPALLPRVRWVWDQIATYATASPNGVSVLMVVLQTSTPPDNQGRSYIQGQIQKLGPSFRRLVMASLGDAFLMNIVRAVMRALVFMTGYSGKLFITATEQEGLSLVMEGAASPAPSLRTLSEALREVHRALDTAGQDEKSRAASISS